MQRDGEAAPGGGGGGGYDLQSPPWASASIPSPTGATSCGGGTQREMLFQDRCSPLICMASLQLQLFSCNSSVATLQLQRQEKTEMRRAGRAGREAAAGWRWAAAAATSRSQHQQPAAASSHQQPAAASSSSSSSVVDPHPNKVAGLAMDRLGLTKRGRRCKTEQKTTPQVWFRRDQVILVHLVHQTVHWVWSSSLAHGPTPWGGVVGCAGPDR